MKKFIILLATFLLCLQFVSCGTEKEKSTSDTTKTIDLSGTVDGIEYTVTDENTDYVIIATDKGDAIILELYPDIAPLTVENFKNLVYTGFYDGIIFHRVIKNFVIQAGDPTGTGYGSSGKTVKGEFELNGVKNELKHTRGVISMARPSQNMDGASSQFFICHKDVPSLDGGYAAFGKVIAGMDTVDRIASVSTDYYDKPVTEQKMVWVRFVTVKK